MVYLIAEIGQNHNGDQHEALCLAEKARKVGFNAIKLTKRDIDSEFTKRTFNRVYTSENAFGRTYGEHRKILEFDRYEYKTLREFAHDNNMDFIITVCDIPSYKDVGDLADKIKIASRDITNLHLIKYLAKNVPLDKEIIFSTGLATDFDIWHTIVFLNNHDLIIMNCTSEYPTKIEHSNLNRIISLKKIKNMYRTVKIGHSDHTGLPLIPLCAVAMGVDVVEVHITSDKYQKGSDHICSLNYKEMYEFAKKARLIEKALGTEKFRDKLEDYLLPAKKKLMKKLVRGQYKVDWTD